MQTTGRKNQKVKCLNKWDYQIKPRRFHRDFYPKWVLCQAGCCEQFPDYWVNWLTTKRCGKRDFAITKVRRQKRLCQEHATKLAMTENLLLPSLPAYLPPKPRRLTTEERYFTCQQSIKERENHG